DQGYPGSPAHSVLLVKEAISWLGNGCCVGGRGTNCVPARLLDLNLGAPMPLRLVSSSSTSFIATRRILAGAALVALGYIVALIASPSAEPPFGVSVGSAAGVKGVGDAGRFASGGIAAN